MASDPARAKQTSVAVGPAHRPGSEAIAAALEQLDYGEAPQIGILGDTGCGKTTILL
jgi:hypothetical protein